MPPIVVLFVSIWANVKTVELGYQLASLAKRREQLLETRRKLEMDRAQAAALARVEDVSRRTLGLVPPTLDQVVLVKDAALSPAPPPARPPAARREAP